MALAPSRDWLVCPTQTWFRNSRSRENIALPPASRACRLLSNDMACRFHVTGTAAEKKIQFESLRPHPNSLGRVSVVAFNEFKK